ncbi:hypothetical protein J1614_011057 [Plenodomus biglobosus]|nr:hypothetical protein J1614_011057 [Plenodomus biglobosus]
MARMYREEQRRRAVDYLDGNGLGPKNWDFRINQFMTGPTHSLDKVADTTDYLPRCPAGGHAIHRSAASWQQNYAKGLVARNLSNGSTRSDGKVTERLTTHMSLRHNCEKTFLKLWKPGSSDMVLVQPHAAPYNPRLRDTCRSVRQPFAPPCERYCPRSRHQHIHIQISTSYTTPSFPFD